MDSLRILIVDDHPLFRSGMTGLLKTTRDMQVVGAAVDGSQAISMAATLQPDVILMDLHMPGMSGIEATRRILQANPNMRVLVVTMFEDEHSVSMALRAGANGYMLKDADEDELLQAIRSVGNGEAIFSPNIARRLLNFFSGPQPSPTFPALTEQEHQVLSLIAQGSNATDIARQSGLTPKMISDHTSSILKKWQITDKVANRDM
ncbi:MAG TPA: response regulator transcription factor [Ktedonobacteraceae bacterium]